VPEDWDLEDIHMTTESRLAQLIGQVAGRLHTARSRNDQVATDFRLWVRDAMDQAQAGLEALQIALVTRADAPRRMNRSPLGAAALAGTGFPIDRTMTAQALGFDGPTDNSLDSVSDRDFALDYLMAASQCSLHLSRLAASGSSASSHRRSASGRDRSSRNRPSGDGPASPAARSAGG